MIERRVAVALGILALAVGPGLGAGPQSEAAADRVLLEGASPAVPRGVLRLLASDLRTFLSPIEELVFSDPTMIQTLETPIVASVDVDRDPTRSYLFLTVGGLHSWRQVAASVAYLYDASFRLYVRSTELPPTCIVPNEISFGLGLDRQAETAPSAQVVDRRVDPSKTALVDGRAFAPIVELGCGLGPTAALDVSRRLVRARSSWTMTARVRVRSVSVFTLHSAALAVFGDHRLR